MIGNSFRVEAESRFFDDFYKYDTVLWPTLTNDSASGTVVVSEATGLANGGILKIPTTAQTNDYQLLSSLKSFEFLASKPVILEARFKITESGANLAHWCFGLTDTVTTGWMTATTGAPPSSYKGAMIWKPATATTIKCETANGTTKNTNAAAGTFVSGTTIQLGIIFDPGDGTTGQVQFLINDQGTNATFVPIKRLPITLSGLAPMCISLGIMASSAAVETMYVDYVAAKTVR